MITNGLHTKVRIDVRAAEGELEKLIDTYYLISFGGMCFLCNTAHRAIHYNPPTTPVKVGRALSFLGRFVHVYF